MPMYNYECDGCGFSFRRRLKISERRNPTGKCQKCHTGIIRQLIEAPALDSSGTYGMKTSDVFNDKMKALSASTPSSMHNLDKIIK